MSIVNLRKAIKYILYLSFFTPLLFLPGQFVFPYIVPKAIFFRSLIILASALSVALYIAERRQTQNKNIKLSTLSISVIFFTFSFVASTFFGQDWYRSFWDIQERMTGLFTIIHYIFLFLLARYVFRTDEEWKRVWQIFLSAGLVVVLIGAIQKISPNFLENHGAIRVVSTLGNPIYLAGYGLFIVFVGALCLISEQKRLWQLYYAAAICVGLAGIFITNTRGTLVGLMVGFSSVAVLVAMSGRHVLRRLRIGLGVGVLVLVLLLGGIFLFKNSSVVANTPIINRVASISPFSGTGLERLMAWKIAISAWREHPVVGWGPNNFYHAFNKYYDPAFLRFGTNETWFDNAHNIFLNTLTTQGVIGFVAYLSMYGAVLYLVWKKWTIDSSFFPRGVLIIGFLVGHAVHSFFVFEDLTSYLYIFLFFGYVDYATDNIGLVAQNRVSNGRVQRGLVVGAIVVGIILVLGTNVNVAIANMTGQKSRYLIAQGKVKSGLSVYDTVSQWHSPYDTDIAWDLSDATLQLLPYIYQSDQKLAREMYDRSVAGMEMNIKRFPLDVRARLEYMDLLRSGGMVLFHLPVESLVDENLRIAELLSPRRQQVEYSKITFLAGKGKNDEAIKKAMILIENDPTIPDSYYTLGRLYQHTRQFKKIIDVLDRAILSGAIFSDPAQTGFAAESYEREGRFKDALFWYDRVYVVTGNERTAYKRDELSRLTQLPVPKLLKEFFPYSLFVSSTPSL